MLVLLPVLMSAVLPVALPQLPTGDPCLRFDVAAMAPVPGAHPLAAKDLATIADIGRSDALPQPTPFGVSPDGRRIAFVIRRADPETNAFCQRLVTMPVDRSGHPTELARGGEFIRDTYRLRDFPAVGAGYAKVKAPVWSPDGRRIAFLERDDGRTQVWIVPSDGTARATRATDLPDDVMDFAWVRDGTALIVATRPGLREQMAAIVEEGRGGYLFDERWSPELALHPLPTGSVATRNDQVELGTGVIREATSAEAALLTGAGQAGRPAQARLFAAGPRGQMAWTEPKDPGQLISESALVLSDGQGQRYRCDEPRCEGGDALFWSRDGSEIYLVHRMGWGKSQTGLLRWRVGDKAPREVLVIEDALVGCVMSTDELICAREGAARPRRIVALDPRTGHERELYEPNPQLRHVVYGEVRRLWFRNANGVECYADLVLPPGHRKGEKHPLVVVQYTSDGFLRGGTGDEVPIHVLAAKGLAVLSFNRPYDPGIDKGAPNETELIRRGKTDWRDRRQVQAALERAIAMALATGTVDPARIGISGFSDGASTTQWALINSNRFKVAMLGQCCEDMGSYPLAAGPAFERYNRSYGFRWFEPDALEDWQPMSLILNVDRIDAPILVQTDDIELQAGLDVAAVFRLHAKPFEVQVLPDETHVPWQPAHRLALYERSTEWFEFWLLHRMNCAPDRADQYARWKAMRGAPPAAELACDTASTPPAQVSHERAQASASTRSSSR